MRLNRGTIILLVISLAVIIGVVVISNNQANQPQAVTPTPAGGGPLFEGVTADQIISLAVLDNSTGEFTRISRASADEDWQVIGPQDLAENEIDQGKATDAVNNVLLLASDSSFEAENLADFGLDQPDYTIEVDTGGESLSVLLVGNRNPSGNRYYVIPRQIEVTMISDATEEATEEATQEVLTGGGTIQLVNQTILQQIIDLVTKPPYMPTATPTVTPTATLNPMSEVEMATATAEAQATTDAMLATLAAEETAQATAEATSESTAEATTEATDESE
jgi:hypothetical protein